MNTQVADDQGICVSCRSPMTGKFCAHCGERRLEPEHWTMRHFFTHTVVEEILNLDGRIWRTLRYLFFRPGSLSVEYCAGRRRPYINPLRIYIVAIIAYALLSQGGITITVRAGPVVLSTAPVAFAESYSVAESVRRIDRFGVLAGLLADKAKTTDVASEEFHRNFKSRFESFYEPLAFANVLLLAAALYLLFRRKYPLFVQHAVFSMHLMSFTLFSSLLFVLAKELPDDAETFAWIVVLGGTLWQYAYLTLALSRFYFAHHRKRVRRYTLAIAAAFLVYVLNSAFITAVQFVGGALALRG